MNPLVYLASYDDLAQIAINSKPVQYVVPGISDPNILLMHWLRHWGKLHYDYHGQYEIAHGLRKKPDFDPWCYIAGYPETKNMFWDVQNDTLNEDLACLGWILYGRIHNLVKCTFSHKISNLILNWCNKNIYILGNSIELPTHIKRLHFRNDSIVIGFNKILNNTPEGIIFDKIICNTVIHKKYKTREKCICISEFNLIDYEEGNFLLTTGLIFIKWVLKYVKFKHLFIAGFNMVEPGEKAHFFDNEKPACPSANFAGHNAQYERKYIKNLNSTNHNVSVIFS